LLNTPKKEIKPKSPGSTTTDDDIAVLETTLLFVVPEKPRFNENIEKGLDERVYDLLETLDKYKYFNEDHTIFTRIVKLLKRNLDECKTTLYCTFWLRQVMYLVDKSSEIILKESIKDISTLLPNIVETTAEDEIYDLDYVSPNLYLEYLKKLVVSFYFKLIELVVHDTKKLIFNCFFEKVKDRKRKKGNELISELTRYLTDFIKLLDEFNIEYIDIFQLVNQILYTYDCYLFNELLSNGNFCTVTHGFNIKLNTADIQDWKQTALSSLYNNPKLISSVVSLDFLSGASNVLIMDKSSFVEEEVRIALRPLTNRHIHRLLTLFTPDDENTDEVPDEVLSLINDDYSLDEILLNDKALRKIELV